jgi:hypothetical protein
MTKEELKKQIADLQEQIENFDKEDHLDDNTYDDFIDEITGEIIILGMSYCASRVLKELDPIAYECSKSDYADSMELEDFSEYTDLVEELEELKSQLEEMEEDDE